MANSRKPPALKVVAGTARKDRDVISVVELPLITEAPKAPDWLVNAGNAHAIKEWDRLAPILTANKLLTEAGCSSLGVLCALHGKIAQLFSAGECPTGHMLAQYRNLVNDFGLTPVAQGKIKAVPEGKQGNKFANNGRKSA